MNNTQYKRIGLIGFGSIGRPLVECLIQHHGAFLSQFSVIVADESTYAAGKTVGVEIRNCRITKDNYLNMLPQLELSAGDLLVQVALDVSSKDVAAWCYARGIHYLDTWIDTWSTPVSKTGKVEAFENWPLRRAFLQDRPTSGPTAVICHGANPGMVSHLVLPGLKRLAKFAGMDDLSGLSAADLAQALGVRTVQISEHDTQARGSARSHVFGGIYSTWAPESFATEAFQSAEIAWGSHEPANHEGWVDIYPESPSKRSMTPGVEVKVKTWTPLKGTTNACVLPHFEAFSIADMLTKKEGDQITYRPTVYYAYRPAPLAWESINTWSNDGYPEVHNTHLLGADLTTGSDALGLLFILDGQAFWYGSIVSLEQARLLNPNMNATASQVVGSLIGAMAWIHENPNRGLVEPEEMDGTMVLEVAKSYLGDIQGHIGNAPAPLNQNDYFQ